MEHKCEVPQTQSNLTCLLEFVFSCRSFPFCNIKQHSQHSGLDIHLDLHLDDRHLDLFDLHPDLHLDYLHLDLLDLHLHPKLNLVYLNWDLRDLYLELPDHPLHLNLDLHLDLPLDLLYLDLDAQVGPPQPRLLAKIGC